MGLFSCWSVKHTCDDKLEPIDEFAEWLGYNWRSLHGCNIIKHNGVEVGTLYYTNQLSHSWRFFDRQDLIWALTPEEITQLHKAMKAQYEIDKAIDDKKKAKEKAKLVKKLLRDKKKLLGGS